MTGNQFFNADPAAIMQKLYQIKAEQDGRDVTIVAHAAVKRTEAAVKDEMLESRWPAGREEIPA